jgi:hypothetical protein
VVVAGGSGPQRAAELALLQLLPSLPPLVFHPALHLLDSPLARQNCIMRCLWRSGFALADSLAGFPARQ